MSGGYIPSWAAVDGVPPRARGGPTTARLPRHMHAVMTSTAYCTLATAGCTALDELQRRASSPALESMDHSASLVDQPPVVLDGLLREGFALLTQPSAHAGGSDGRGPVAAWRQVFALSAVLRAGALLEAKRWAPAARHLDLALLLGDAGPELAAALSPLLTQASAGLRDAAAAAGSGGGSGGQRRRSPRLSLRSLGGAAALPRVREACAARLSAPPSGVSLHLLGGMEDWAALRPGGWAASLPAVRERLGLRTVPVEVGLGSWGGRARDGRQQRLMRLDDFLDELVLRTRRPAPLEEAPLAVTPTVPVTAARCEGYLAQHQLFKQVPELLQEVGLELLRLVGDPTPMTTAQEARVWLGPEGTVTPLHFDWHENVLCQLLGEKLVILCHPPGVGAAEGGGSGGGGGGSGDDDDACMYPCEGVPNASRVDAERPALATFPRFGAVERRACVLRAGEALYIPQGCWHYARSLTPSLSVSFWFTAPG